MGNSGVDIITRPNNTNDEEAGKKVQCI